MKPFSVLVTRPSPQGELLCAELRTHHFEPIFFPVMVVKPLENALNHEQIIHLDQYDWVVFVSKHAVTTSAALIHQQWPEFPVNLKVAAVGEGTALALQLAKLPVHIYPVSEWSSEGLLALPELAELNEKKIAIICGHGGREFLVTALQARGALVTPIITYQRELPEVDMGPYWEKLPEINAMVCTSGEGVGNLKKLFLRVIPAQAGIHSASGTAVTISRMDSCLRGNDMSNPHWPILQKIPLVLVSERIMILAKEHGFEKCFLAKNASHEGILQALQMIRNDQMSHTSTQTADSPQLAPKKKSVWTTLVWLLAFTLLALFLVAGAAFFRVYQLSQNVTGSLARFSEQITVGQQQIGALQEKWLIMQQQQQDLVQHHTVSPNALTSVQNIANVLDAEYWTHLASYHLLIASDLPVAIRLLNLALNEISNLSDPGILPVKHALEQDIATLKNTPWVNTSDLYLGMLGVQKQVDSLPLLIVPAQADVKAPAVLDLASMSAWERGWHSAWDALRQMVVIHRVSPHTPPFITPDQRAYVYQNLHATLNNAMSAALRHDEPVYSASLQLAIEWIHQYFLQTSGVTKSVLDQLQALLATTVQPSRDLALASPQAFQKYIK